MRSTLVLYVLRPTRSRSDWSVWKETLNHLQHILVDGWFDGITNPKGLTFEFQLALILSTGGALARS
jgi:short subunit fatty acids transporter